MGRTEDFRPIYEAVCRDGPGYLLVGGPEPLAFNCLALEAQLETERRRATRRALPPVCHTPSNRNAVPVVTRFARRAGLDCRVDEGALIGVSVDDSFIYEAGCRDDVGAWLEADGDGWIVTDCITVAAQGGECRFTTQTERALRANRWLATPQAGDAGQGCRAADARYMGAGPSGAWYETTCASGRSVVLRLEGGTVAEVLACSDATGIGGGCRSGRAAGE
ncbi:hypothetical protein [Brevundimonas sp.]|uniref:hypothetical protein n=1 Tax=Brevundimonas sp. TaxID=1871086 RepID=UPI002D518ECC|nr:hypothetical protein [Brevundimonas sp.]HYC67980.1 hypothetical protein [Brevundimonas sp.]